MGPEGSLGRAPHTLSTGTGQRLSRAGGGSRGSRAGQRGREAETMHPEGHRTMTHGQRGPPCRPGEEGLGAGHTGGAVREATLSLQRGGQAVTHRTEPASRKHT